MHCTFFVFAVLATFLELVSGKPIFQQAEKRQIIPAGLVNLNFTHVTAHLNLLALLTNQMSVDFDSEPYSSDFPELALNSLEVAPVISDPLNIVGLTITGINLSASVDGVEYFAVQQTFDTPLAAPTSGTVNSGSIPNVNLTQGFLPTLLKAAPAGAMDVSAGVTFQVSLLHVTLPVPLFLPLAQAGVPTTASSTPVLEERQIPVLTLGINVVKVDAHFTGASLLNNQIQQLAFDFSLILPLLSPITTIAIDSVSLTATSGTTSIFTAEKTFDPPIVVPSSGSVNSGIINDVTLTQGSASTLGVVGNAALNVNANFMTKVTIITDPLTIPLPVIVLDLNVPTNYTCSLL
ncbi:hypothetical protein ONZ45_g6365 [Pleurotus djamor]|nr:hypothetical protein ONZ45_g6365 [Pleurotus djamor]